MGHETVAALRNMDPIRTDGEKNGGTGQCTALLVGQLGWDLAGTAALWWTDLGSSGETGKEGKQGFAFSMKERYKYMGTRRQAAWERMGQGQRRHR